MRDRQTEKENNRQKENHIKLKRRIKINDGGKRTRGKGRNEITLIVIGGGDKLSHATQKLVKCALTIKILPQKTKYSCLILP